MNTNDTILIFVMRDIEAKETRGKNWPTAEERKKEKGNQRGLPFRKHWLGEEKLR